MRSHAFRGTADPAVKISVVEPDPGSLKAQSKIPNPLRRGPPVDGNFDGRGPPSHGPNPNPQSSRRGPPVDGNFDGRGPPSHGPIQNPQSSPAGSAGGRKFRRSAGGRKFRRAGSAVPRPKPQSAIPNRQSAIPNPPPLLTPAQSWPAFFSVLPPR
jgi:hypothetical protein